MTVPPSGNLDVSIGAIVTPGSDPAAETAILATSVNGGSEQYPLIEVEAPANSGLAETAYAESEISGLTPGATVTLSVLAWVSTSGVSATFSEVTLKATPV